MKCQSCEPCGREATKEVRYADGDAVGWRYWVCDDCVDKYDPPYYTVSSL